jgi:hypothetical protein
MTAPSVSCDHNNYRYCMQHNHTGTANYWLVMNISCQPTPSRFPTQLRQEHTQRALQTQHTAAAAMPCCSNMDDLRQGPLIQPSSCHADGPDASSTQGPGIPRSTSGMLEAERSTKKQQDHMRYKTVPGAAGQYQADPIGNRQGQY